MHEIRSAWISLDRNGFVWVSTDRLKSDQFGWDWNGFDSGGLDRLESESAWIVSERIETESDLTGLDPMGAEGIVSNHLLS